MCGRFTLTASAEALQELFPLFDWSVLPPRYNIAPTQKIVAVRRDEKSGQPQLALLRWGLIPSWADDPKIGYRLINARAETAASKATFRSAFKQRHCLVLADGFFEWQKTGAAKQPYYLRLKDGQPFAFAGLWEHWHKDDQAIDSCTILTTEANDLVRPVHDRMPVILDRGRFDRWLDAAANGDWQALLQPFPSEAMTAYPVNSRVNNVRHDDPTCIAAVVLPSAEAREISLFPQEEEALSPKRKSRKTHETSRGNPPGG